MRVLFDRFCGLIGYHGKRDGESDKGVRVLHAMLYISHDSALHFWRTNPSVYYLEGADRNIRQLRGCPSSARQLTAFNLPEIDFGPDPIDILVPPGSTRLSGKVRCHVQTARLPPRSIYPLYGGIHVVSPSLCFVEECRSRNLPEAVALGMEFCGTYALRPHGTEGAASRNYQLIEASAFRRRVASWRDLAGVKTARRASMFMVNGAASPMETMLYMLLCLPQRLGGYNLPMPEMNAPLHLPADYRLLLHRQNVLPDLLWRDAKLVVEYDGGYHDNDEQRARDEARRVALESMGYTVYSVKKQQVYDPVMFDKVARRLAEKFGRKIRPLSPKQSYAREELRSLLP